MKFENITTQLSVSGQLSISDIPALKESGVELIVCNRPDGEEKQQTPFDEISAEATKQNIETVNLPFSGANFTDDDCLKFAELITSKKRIHAYCRTGNRCKKIISAATTYLEKSEATMNQKSEIHIYDEAKYDVVIIGAGSGGIATASSILKRRPNTRIALIEPSEDHYYQPGWTMVGGGVFNVESTKRRTADLIPNGCDWVQFRAEEIKPDSNQVILDGGAKISYKHLVVAVGLKLDWYKIEGLEETLGKNGVTSNYRYDLAPYTWSLVKGLNKGRALFCQPPMPIKCAGAPQKAMYLSGSEWFKENKIGDVEIEFYNAGGVLFGVEAYVPSLMKYVEKYQAKLNFLHTLVKVDGESKTAWFKTEEGKVIERNFDMIHVVPPQSSPDFINESSLSDDAGWLDVDQYTLQQKNYENVWGVGDIINAPNAKTMAAARKQAPVVAQNLVNALNNDHGRVYYDGYGSCPLTVERGKIVLAEFGYPGLLPSFPSWINDGTKPTTLSWVLKKDILPALYWHGMLKGREWMASPNKSKS